MTDRVFIAPCSYQANTKQRAYHTRRCKYVKPRFRKVDLEYAKKRDFSLCDICNPEVDSYSNSSPSRQSLKSLIEAGEVPVNE